MEFKKNDRVTVTIEDMGSDGEGIGKVDGFTLFIKALRLCQIREGVTAFSFSCGTEMCIPQTVRRLSAAGTLLLRAAAFQGTEDPQ